MLVSMPILLWLNDNIAVISGSWLGLCVGSFLNVVIYRYFDVVKRFVSDDASSSSLPGDLVAHSRCTSCGEPILKRDNIPLLSWLILKGKSRCCKTPISKQYPLIEVLTAITFILIAFCHGNSISTVLLWLTSSLIIVLSVWIHKIISL